MCGINGYFYFDRNRRADEGLVHSMRAVAKHRGPDDRGSYLQENVGLGFNRLSIIDLAGGHQPMSNEDGTVWIVFNGEIYNFQKLRNDLIARGHKFATRSDTETIVHAWEEHGERCPELLRGMFAFAIWDSRRKILFAARDRLGIKPFYYYKDGEVFAFGSELKSLLELPDIPREVDVTALAEYLLHRYVNGSQTMLRGVQKLPPGHSVTVQESGVSVRRYWELPVEEPRKITERAALDEFGSLMEETLRQHLVADVPLGAFLSGGLDSSAVVALMAKLGVSDIKTFSIGYDSPESELPYARLVADRFHTDHYELRLTPADFQGLLPRIIWHMDEPVADEAALPLYFVSRLARQHVTVALSGEGSDEIFSGYPIYRTMTAIETMNRFPLAGLAGRLLDRFAGGKVRKYGRMLGRPLESRYGGVSTVLSRSQISRFMPTWDWSQVTGSEDGVATAYRACQDLPLLTRMSFVDLKTWLPNDLLVKADRMSMANHLELRVPFLDHRVVEFAFRLPAELKIHGGQQKYLLKKYMEPLLPREIIHREKKGFPVPTKSWFRNELADFARETLLASGGASEKFFVRSEVEQLLNEHESRDRSGEIYALLVFDQWYRMFVSRTPAARQTSVFS